MDAAILAGDDNWTWTEGDRGRSYLSDRITTTNPYTLALGIGSGAVENLYDIVVHFVGKKGKGAPFGFSVNVASEPSADFDADGDVDGNDFIVWQWGAVSNPPSAADLSLWQAHFSANSLSSVAIPEPTTLLLALFGLSIIGGRRRKSVGSNAILR